MKPVSYAFPELNTMSWEQIEQHQEALLRKQIQYCYSHSSYYQDKFKEHGLEPGDIRTLDDLRRMPILMTKEDERASGAESLRVHGHPFGMHLCASPAELFLTATTSGTTGTPTFTYTFTREDLDLLSVAVGHRFGLHGIEPGDRFMFCFALGIYATSMSLPGIRSTGALPIDIDTRAGTKMILEFAVLTRPAWLACTPSLAEYMAAKAPEIIGKPVNELGLKGLFLTGETWAGIPELKKKLETLYGCPAHDYWTPAGQACAVSCGCEEYHGLHAVAPNLCASFQDLVDPVTKAPVPFEHGAIGEMVHTSLQRKAAPALKYAYGDVIQLFLDPCPGCGFHGPRAKVIGRADDMLIVKGVNVYPAAIKTIINGFFPDVTGEMRIVLNSRPPRVVPPLQLKIEHGSHVGPEQRQGLGERIKAALHNTLKINPEITWVQPASLEKSAGKTPLFEKQF